MLRSRLSALEQRVHGIYGRFDGLQRTDTTRENESFEDASLAPASDWFRWQQYDRHDRSFSQVNSLLFHLVQKFAVRSDPVQNLVAFPTKRDQVGLCIVTQGAAPSDVVHIEIPRASTFLTAPTITFQDFPAQLRV